MGRDGGGGRGLPGLRALDAGVADVSKSTFKAKAALLAVGNTLGTAPLADQGARLQLAV